MVKAAERRSQLSDEGAVARRRTVSKIVLGMRKIVVVGGGGFLEGDRVERVSPAKTSLLLAAPATCAGVDPADQDAANPRLTSSWGDSPAEPGNAVNTRCNSSGLGRMTPSEWLARSLLYTGGTFPSGCNDSRTAPGRAPDIVHPQLRVWPVAVLCRVDGLTLISD